MDVRIEGEAAGAAAEALRVAFGGGELQAIALEDGGRRAIDRATAIGLASLVLALPGAVLTGLELLDRTQPPKAQREAVQAVIDTAVHFRDNHGTVIVVQSGGAPVSLAELSVGQLLELMQAEADKAP